MKKKKKCLCIPFYEDNNQTLSTIVNNFFRENKIPISQESINVIGNGVVIDPVIFQTEIEKIKRNFK